MTTFTFTQHVKVLKIEAISVTIAQAQRGQVGGTEVSSLSVKGKVGI